MDLRSMMFDYLFEVSVDTCKDFLGMHDYCCIRTPDNSDDAIQIAKEHNMVNSPPSMFLSILTGLIKPEHIAVLTTRYWRARKATLGVTFMESTPIELQNRIIDHANAWDCGITFELSRYGQVRITREGDGYWSYLGTDIMTIPTNRPTMCLSGFTMNTPENEFTRVVRHEIGHTLGFVHEHMRRELVEQIDPVKAYSFFRLTQGWSKQMVNAQVLTPLSINSIIGTPADQTSIMCYQLPGSITRSGKPIVGGLDINEWDRSFAQKLYPKD